MNVEVEASSSQPQPVWGAVFSMALGVFGLVTAELLPASLLTPIASSLGVSEGQAGQTVAVTAAVALVTCLAVSAATRKIDRRNVLLGFSVLQIASNLLVALAPNLIALLAARILLGIAIGGFWTMAAATTMRLVPSALVPRALSITLSGISLATVAAIPLGSYLDGLFGWRVVFLLAMGLSILSFAWQWWALPIMKPIGHTSLRMLVQVLRRPGMGYGMLACMLVFVGHFAFFTYLRPYIELMTGFGVNGVSVTLLAFGVTNFLGTSMAGLLAERNLRLTLLMVPLSMGLLGFILVTLGHAPITVSVLIALWGIVSGILPVVWNLWIIRTVPDEAESGSGLFMATVQLAITLGASGGGLLFDISGARGVFAGAALMLIAAAAVIFVGLRQRQVSTSSRG